MHVKSAIDWWFNLIFWGAIVLITVSLFFVPKNEKWIGYLVGIPMIIFMLSLYFGTYYELREDHLYCRSGPFFERIPYENIKSVRLSNNLLSSMALSSKRIEIRQHNKGYITGTTLISPVNREEFMQELISRCKNLE